MREGLRGWCSGAHKTEVSLEIEQSGANLGGRRGVPGRRRLRGAGETCKNQLREAGRGRSHPDPCVPGKTGGSVPARG